MTAPVQRKKAVHFADQVGEPLVERRIVYGSPTSIAPESERRIDEAVKKHMKKEMTHPIQANEALSDQPILFGATPAEWEASSQRFMGMHVKDLQTSAPGFLFGMLAPGSLFGMPAQAPELVVGKDHTSGVKPKIEKEEAKKSHIKQLFDFSGLTLGEKFLKGLKLLFGWFILIPYALYQDRTK